MAAKSPKSILRVQEIQLLPTIARADRTLTTSSQPQCVRKIRSPAVILGIILNFLVAASPTYFLVFAWLVFRCSGQPAESRMSQSLLQASTYGPTVFPLVFAAVVGRFMKSYASRKLEHGTNIALIEYLLQSRSVSGALLAPVRFRVWRWVIVPLLVVWALSPLGSQASFRVVSTGMMFQNSSQLISYLDVNTSIPLTAGSSGASAYLTTVNAAFVTAIYGPADAKDASQDPFGHVKVPMLESVQWAGSNPSKDGWYTMGPALNNLTTYSSLAGLPCSGMPSDANITFSIETSYFYTDCQVDAQSLSNTSSLRHEWAQLDPGQSGTAWNGAEFAMSWDPAHNSSSPDPRQMYAWSLDIEAKMLTTGACRLTTTYVELQVNCVLSNCQTIAIRQSTLPRPTPSWSIMDITPGSGTEIWMSFVNSTAKGHAGMSSPIEYFLHDPRAAIGSLSEVFLGGVDNHSFSQRFAQLLNTYWMISLAPDAALGVDFLHDPQQEALSGDTVNDPDHETIAGASVGIIHSQTPVLYCDKAWLAVLTLASLTMLIAGIVTAVFDASRKGPDIIDLFVSTLRENQFAKVEHFSSLEDGSAQVRRLRDTRVVLGDVQPSADVGYVTITTSGKDTEVQPLLRGRQYL